MIDYGKRMALKREGELIYVQTDVRFSAPVRCALR